jgi:uncharacterized protein (DUF885 family)
VPVLRTTLRALADEFFVAQNTADPLSATQLGIAGYDHLVPDFSREGSARAAARFARIETAVASLDLEQATDAERVDAAVLARLAWAARTDVEMGIWERDASAEGYASPPSMIFMCTPAGACINDEASDNYVARLRGLAGCFDAITTRYGQALADGFPSSRAGLRRLSTQLRGHLENVLSDDILANPPIGDGVDGNALRARTYPIVRDEIRPALARLVAFLEGPMLEAARDDERCGLGHLPHGPADYATSLRRHTTTDLSPDEIHAIGRAHLEALNREWAEVGQRVFGERDVPTILARLRDDPTLRCSSSAQIVDIVTRALERAEAARDAWFPPYDIAPCVVEEIHPIEAQSAALAHYRPPSPETGRPGAHCVLTTEPSTRFVYEYEALAFHESTPGHHLQLATAQAMTDLPTYRRFLDVQVCGFVEGWGLYAERLADEMGLYTSDVARLGMISFDALRACRLVVDTGIHHLGWSRQQAIDFMYQHTATTLSNVTNEIDRYIGWPGQACAYMIGRLEIERLRRDAEQRLGAQFDVRSFHGIVLENGAVPLQVLANNVAHWVQAETERLNRSGPAT